MWICCHLPSDSSEEEDAEKVDADSHSDSSSEDELVKLEVRRPIVQPDNFRDIAPSRKNKHAKTHDKMLENT